MTELVSPQEALKTDDLHDLWPVLSREERAAAFRLLPREEAEEFFEQVSARDQAELMQTIAPRDWRLWLRLLAPDDAADLIQEAAPDAREPLLAALDPPARKEVSALLAYAEDAAGGLMSPRYARLRPDLSVDEAIRYLRLQARERPETLSYVYVIDGQQHLLGVVSLRELFAAAPQARVREIMETDVIAVRDDQDQESVSRLFARHDLVAIPVVDAENRVQGVVTLDDIVDVVQEEATRDQQRFGGTEALDAPYMEVRYLQMIRKRGGWLTVLFLGEMLTATAMTFFEDEIARAVVLALFVPLIISSGGNSGSQASTLVIRAMALGELRVRDWWRVVRRELAAGLALGALLGAIGLIRIEAWQAVRPIYGEHHFLIALTVCVSLIGVVTFGTLTGSLLPFVFRSIGFDPASASAPFVATLVDVTGLVIYFTAASAFLGGTLL